ncbi:leucine-rich repeat and IQ domain-containing protein 1 [Patella vulgata]|uniref:leucine-rich repeat and IQ domain-containing protein 1 n=1 Tax=Patella vulgata TaxID=6465 RepID=UPI00217F2777|nr:leucine-rich repeat and IQ domain-containing protein 1 [Patella vulgata]XP_050408808.1 leucine-rich repeat and IQ domain-containing protein 1 [Patella vulgata]XP_050408809.1 leucine-rich repeat and IQ domain-containing protein 1 [Patella vulgata]
MMDEESILDAEIQQQLELINLDELEDEDPINCDENFDVENISENNSDVHLSKDLQAYLDMVQQQSNRLEEELRACDDVLNYTNTLDTNVAPLNDVLLEEEAKLRGIDHIELQRQILADVEKNEIILTEESDEEDDKSIGDEKALVLLDDHMRMKKQLVDQLKQIEQEYEDKKLKSIEENKNRQLEEEAKNKLNEERRQVIRTDLQKQEQELEQLKMTIHSKLEKEYEEQQEDMKEKRKIFEEKIAEMTETLEREKNSLNQTVANQKEKQKTKENASATLIQKTFRGYKVKKQYGDTLNARIIEGKEKRMEDRIKQIEEEKQKIQNQEEELKRQEMEKERLEEEKKKEEQRKIEDEKLKAEKLKKEQQQKEAERLKEEERNREEERLKEKQRQIEAEKLNEEQRKREEELKEEQRKKEEERLKEEQQKLEEERQKEEQRKREEDKLKEEERLKEEQQKLEEEKRKAEQQKVIDEKLEKENQKREEKRKMEEERLKEEKKKIEEEKLKQLKGENNTSANSMTDELEKRRLAWIKDCLPWSKISNEPWKLKVAALKKPPRRSATARKLPPLDEKLILSSAESKSLKQVTTLELLNLPGFSLSTLGECWGLQYLTLTKCNLVAIDGLSQCKQLQYLNLQDNVIEYVDVKDLGKLQVVNLSHNKISAIHGLDGCINIRYLDLAHNKITRLGGLSSLRRLHTLLCNNNQLIDTSGLSDVVMLQILDVSNNHLQSLTDVYNSCLLQKLVVSNNNLQQVPDLSNNVLLDELDLCNNSISSLSSLSTYWLPLLHTLKLDQNSISELPNLANLFLLQTALLSQNEIVDVGNVTSSLSNCQQLKTISVEGNPAFDDPDNRTKLTKCFSRLSKIDKQDVQPSNHSKYKCNTGIEEMCCYQSNTYHNMVDTLLKELLKLQSKTPVNQAKLCSCYFTFCDKAMQTAVEFRYAHEYGDTTIPSNEPNIKSSQSKSNQVSPASRQSVFSTPKDMFEKALKKGSDPVPSNNPKNLFEKALNNSPKDMCETAFKKSGDPVLSNNPKDMFEKALRKSSEPVSSNDPKNLFEKALNKSSEINSSVDIEEIWVAAIIIQSAWRGYRTRQKLKYPQEWHQAATMIQAAWRGYYLRRRLQMALNYAQFEEAMDMDLPDIDANEYNFDEKHFDMDWRPADTPQLPQRHPVLGKPPLAKKNITGVPVLDINKSPPQIKHAWRNLDSPLSEIRGPHPRPPSSLNSTIISHRSKKSEQLSEEWGFKDSRTADLMIQRAKKMKYNAQRKKKLGKLDPKQRLALFRKLEETAPLNPVTPPVRKILPRKEYFQAREEEILRQDRDKRIDISNRANRTYEWLHTQVGDHDLSSPTPRHGVQSTGHYGSTSSLTYHDNHTKSESHRSPCFDMKSLRQRRHSASEDHSYWGKPTVLPPIKTTSAPSKPKEKMSWRNPVVEKSVGWGGGKKRSARK